MRKSAPFAVLFVCFVVGGLWAPASQAAIKWTFTDSNCIGPCSSAERVFAGEALNGEPPGNVRVSAWGATEPGTINNELASAALNQFGGGLGVTNGDSAAEGDSASPEHAMDSKDRFDVMLFDFGAQSISLTMIEIGWYFNDRDISVLAYEGTGVPSVEGSRYATDEESLTSEGWTLVGNFDVNASEGNGVLSQSISTAVSSSYWLVGAYNPVFGACQGNDVCSFGYDPSGNNKHDYVKLLSLSGTVDGPDGVAEPGSLLLLAAAGVLAGYRRRELLRIRRD